MDRIEAAGAALLGETPEAEPIETVSELEPAQAESAAEAEPPAEPPEDAEPKDAEPEPEPEEKAGSLAWRVAQAKRYRAQADKKLAEVSQRLEQLEAREAAIAEREKLADLLSSDPEAALEKLAQLSGRTSTDFYEDLTRRRLAEYDDEQTGAAQYRSDLEQIRAEFREELKRRDEQREKAFSEHQKQRHESAITSLVNDFVGAADDPVTREKFPHFASWPRERIATQARTAIDWAQQNAPETQIPDIIEALDKIARQEYELITRNLSAQGGAPPNGKTAQGHGNPAFAKPEAGRKPATISNATTASNGSARRPMTHEERLAEAAKLLPDFSI